MILHSPSTYTLPSHVVLGGVRPDCSWNSTTFLRGQEPELIKRQSYVQQTPSCESPAVADHNTIHLSDASETFLTSRLHNRSAIRTSSAIILGGQGNLASKVITSTNRTKNEFHERTAKNTASYSPPCELYFSLHLHFAFCMLSSPSPGSVFLFCVMR
ncbi:hypothetical protein BDM02DRAFT_930500 [Thelephora ganbajun]|uniref:Uncharacterized protein n=1 Tax=Thelephora ganbajun TaxID=370292 RepID=A0ACB6Z469_THEGA|nr:hypothetical protein BDM02DRAFT_930500 [Thelephora ganbajun]